MQIQLNNVRGHRGLKGVCGRPGPITENYILNSLAPICHYYIQYPAHYRYMLRRPSLSLAILYLYVLYNCKTL